MNVLRTETVAHRNHDGLSRPCGEVLHQVDQPSSGEQGRADPVSQHRHPRRRNVGPPAEVVVEITEGRHGPHQSRCAGLRKFEGVCNLDSRSGPLVLLKEFQHVEHALRRLDRGLHLRKVAGRIAGAIRAVERTQTGCRACIRQIFLRHRHRYFPCCATRRFSHQPYCSGQCDHSGSHPSSSAVWAGQFGFHSSSRPSAISVALPSLRMASAY